MVERATRGERFANSKFATENRVGRKILSLVTREREVMAPSGTIWVREIKAKIIYGKYRILEGKFNPDSDTSQ
jgi:hypothetical protein